MQDMLASLMGGGPAQQGNRIGGAEGDAAPAVQPLTIKQAPKPEFKNIEDDAAAEEADGAAKADVDAPEEEDLD